MKPVDAQSFGRRLAARRHVRGLSQSALGAAVGMRQQGIEAIESGKVRRPRLLREIAQALATSEDWLLWGEGAEEGAAARPEARTEAHNARIGGPLPGLARIALYGHAVGGSHGQFPLNGNFIMEVDAPPSLAGVAGAYAVMVVGSSMEPRYFAGETVFVNPHLPVRPGDFVVAQVSPSRAEARNAEAGFELGADTGEPPLAYVKRYLGRGARETRFEQLNPGKKLAFANERMVSIHRVVMSGST